MRSSILLCVVIFLKLCELTNFQSTGDICHLEDNYIGKCVPTSMCPQILNKTKDSNSSKEQCGQGKTCCRVSSKIVTPDDGNNIAPAAAPFSQATSTTASPQWVSVIPVVVNPTSNPSSGTVSTSGGSPPNGSAPPTTSASTPSGSFPSIGSSPSGGSGPPNSSGNGPPNGVTPGAAPPGTAGPPSGGSPPPLLGNIVAEPRIPPKSFPCNGHPDISDTVIISAEVIDNAIEILDRKCDLYNSIIEPVTPVPKSQGSFTPVVYIYGGTDSEEKEFPHMAALGYGDPNAKQWLCAGSLITENFVLTAAHCLSAQPLGEVRYVKLGSLRLDQDTQNTQILNIIMRIPHEQYDPRGQYNDIALLQLDQSVRITNYVKPICIFSSTNYEDRNLIATGWGKTESGSVSLTLQKVGLELFTQTECQTAYSLVPKQQLPFGIQEAMQLCAGSHSQNKDTCQGDSGGPLQIRKNNRWYLIGITSIGLGCGVANTPGVYTRVANYVHWIQQYLWNK